MPTANIKSDTDKSNISNDNTNEDKTIKQINKIFNLLLKILKWL